MFVTPRLAVAAGVAALVPVVLTGAPVPALIASWGVLLVLIAADVLTAPRPEGVVVGRIAPPVATVGATSPVMLDVRNPGRRSARIAIRDTTAPSLMPGPDRLDVVLPPGRSRLRYDIEPRRRGRFVLGPATVRAYGPFGLSGRQGRVAVESAVKVYPELRGRKQVQGALRRGRLLDAGMRSAQIRGGGLEFDSLREYHRDDEFRAINWVATARAAKPISNLYREERNQQLLLLMDAGRTMAGTVGGAPRFEHAMDAAVAVASVAANIGDRVGGFVFSDRVQVSVRPGSGGAQVGRLVDALFAIEPQVVASDYRRALGVVLGRYRRRAMVVLFTDLADESALDTLLDAVPPLARRHLVVVAQVADPEIQRLVRLLPADADEAFLKAAATSLSARRQRGVVRLARLGATVVDQPPGRLAPALADVYLRAKAYGRL